jgi:hypothetical protein
VEVIMRSAVALTLSVLAITGCEREPAPKAPAAQSISAPPFSFADRSAAAEVKLALPAALARHPVLHRTLYDREVAALRAFAADALAMRAELDEAAPAYSMEVEWGVAGETDRLLSLVREEYAFAGGAHPNTASTTLLFDKRAGREVELAALFPDRAANPALEAALCDALKTEKVKRGGVPLDGDVWTCPRLAEAQAALAPAVDGRSTGLTFHFSPYEVGPYAEGGYEITLPARTIRSALATGFRDQFEGG